MVFWIGILFGCLFVWLAVKKGFYETWILLFNAIIAVYLAIFLGPVIANIVPIAPKSAYNNALCMMIPGVGAFLILYAITATLFTGQFSIPFTKTIDTFFAGFFGFLAGFLIWCFLSLLICISPISQNTFVSELDFAGGFRQTGAPYVSWWCNRVHSMVASKGSDVTSGEVISELIKKAEEKPPFREVQPGISTPSDDIKTSSITDPNN